MASVPWRALLWIDDESDLNVARTLRRLADEADKLGVWSQTYVADPVPDIEHLASIVGVYGQIREPVETY